jgi:hypothetical protein
LSVGSPVLGQSSLLVSVGLTAARLTVAPPVLDLLTLEQRHLLVGISKAVGSPIIGKPILARKIVLVPLGKTVSAPILGVPSLAHRYTLTGVSMAVSSPLFELPIIHQVVAFDVVDWSLASPSIGKPSIGQYFVLTAKNLSVRPPRFTLAWLTYEGHDLLFAIDLAVGSIGLPLPEMIVITEGLADSSFDVLIDSGTSSQATSDWSKLATASAQPAQAA